MHLLHPQLPLAFLRLEPWMIAIIVPVVAMVFGGIMAITGMYFSSRERERWHETARIALEKGQPLPPMPGGRHHPGPDGDRENLAQHDVRGGLVLIGVGLGLWLMLDDLNSSFRFVAAIPGFIGVALLVYALGRVIFGRKSKDTDRHPPQS